MGMRHGPWKHRGTTAVCGPARPGGDAPLSCLHSTRTGRRHDSRASRLSLWGARARPRHVTRSDSSSTTSMSGKLESVWGIATPRSERRVLILICNYRLYIDTVITSVKKQLSVLGTRIKFQRITHGRFGTLPAGLQVSLRTLGAENLLAVLSLRNTYFILTLHTSQMRNNLDDSNYSTLFTLNHFWLPG